MIDPQDIEPSRDQFSLRGLLWCRACDRPMVPAEHFSATTRPRTYVCELGCHRHTPAESAESIAWTAAERQANVSTIPPECRKTVLEMLLAKALFDHAGGHLTFVWRI